MSASWTITARWILPVDRPPIERGTVTIEGERIVAVEAFGCRRADIDAGNAAILPGFVNAHTHLDLTGLRGLTPPSPDFVGWLREVIRHRRAQTPEQVQTAIQAGIAEALRFGTTLLGDIASEGMSWESLTGAPLRAVVFRELLGLPRDRAKQAWWDMLRWCKDHPATATCRPAVSPHAPYSVNASLVRAAAWNGFQMAIHLAETEDELLLLRDQSGPFVDFLQELGVWHPAGLAASIDWILERTSGGSSILYVHANYLKPDANVPENGTIVYCPRTHAAFGHMPHPWRDFLVRGVRVVLGTDSLASNPDLDVLAEARFLKARFPDVPGDVILRMATLSGAEALGWQGETGSLTPGKSADLVVLPLPDDERADPHDLVLQSACEVKRVLFRGQWHAN